MKNTCIRALAALLLCGTLLLCACDSGNAPADTTSGELPADTTTGEPEKTVLDVVVGGEAKLTIMRADEAASSIKNGCIALRNKMNELLSADFELDNDWVRPGDEIPADAAEILVGETNRPASVELLASLPENSYAIKVTEHQIIIIGTNNSMTACALYDFEENYLNNPDYRTEGGLSIPVGTDMLVTDVDDVTEYLSIPELLATDMPVAASISNKRIQNGVGSFGTAQGAATDGEYFYMILKKKVDGVETDVIVKRRMDDWSEVAVSEELPLGHANDMCYNSRDKVLVVTNMVGGTLSVIDPETLTLIKQVNADVGVAWAIGYNAKRECYCVAGWGGIFLLDSDFQPTGLPNIEIYQEPGYTGQGMDCDDDFIYMPMSGVNDNVIIVIPFDGGSTRVVHLDTTMESETIMNWDGKYYVHFNSGGSRICDLTFEILYQ